MSSKPKSSTIEESTFVNLCWRGKNSEMEQRPNLRRPKATSWWEITMWNLTNITKQK